MTSGFFKKMWQENGRGRYADIEVQLYFPKTPDGKPAPREIVLGDWLTPEVKAAALDELEIAWEGWGRPGCSLKAIEHSCSYCDTCEQSIRRAINEATNQAMKAHGYCIDGGYW